MLVCLDAGHGGSDPGSTGIEGIEADYTLLQVLVAESVFRSEGIATVLTRRDDRYVSLSDRVETANESGADAFLSFHWNYASIPQASGSQMLYWRTSARAADLALCLLEEVGPLDGDVSEPWERVVPMPDPNFRRSPDGSAFEPYVLKYTAMPAVIVETEFGSNPEAGKLFETARYPIAVAQAAARAIRAWTG